MARIRTVKPELFTDPDLAKCSLGARWLFVGLFTEADDKGRLIDSPKRLAGAIFPHEPKVTAAKVTAWLDELEGIDAVRRYDSEGHRLLWLPHFNGHQKISHPTPSKLEPHPEDVPKSSGAPPEDVPKDSRSDCGSGSGSGNQSAAPNDSGGLRLVEADETIDEAEYPPHPLADRWHDVLRSHGAKTSQQDARAVIARLLPVASPAMIDERIGYIDQTATGLSSAGYLATTVMNFLAAHHQPNGAS